MTIPDQRFDPNPRFVIPEELWGLIAIVPEENREDVANHFGRQQRSNNETGIVRFRSSVEHFSFPGSEHLQELGRTLPRRDPLQFGIIKQQSNMSALSILDEKVAIEARNIRHADLADSFGGLLPPADMVLTPRATSALGWRCRNCFALGRTGGSALYGTQDAGVVTSLHLEHNQVEKIERLALAKSLVKMGELYRLVLVDWPNRRIVALSALGEVEAYLRLATAQDDTHIQEW
jgi:hypothetical protein